ncbi:general substrate transporter [Dichotomocladium elegans]|nr:general substrate transporter [Dichotomocladium elegans]
MITATHMHHNDTKQNPQERVKDIQDHTRDVSSSGFKGILENPYAFAVALFASLGGVLFGYDQGVISGVQEMETFTARFPMTSTENGFVVSILELGAWLGSWMVGYFADRISRKYSIVLFSVVFLLGSAIQGAAQSLDYLFAGRFVTGVAVGALSMLVPLYQSEIAPPTIRGSLVALQQLAVTFGILISFWIDFGTQHMASEAQWRVPLCLQLAIGLILGVGILFFPFSPHWLMSVGREEESLRVLSRLRRLRLDHPHLLSEWREIKTAVEFDRQAHPDPPRFANFFGYRDLFLSKGIAFRLFIACAIMFLQQFTGINALIYYAPKIFLSVGLQGNQVSLLATGVVGIINFLMTLPAVLYLDKFGRKPMLMTASVVMTICMAVVAAISGLFSSDWEAHTAEGWVAVVFVYLFIGNFAYSWGPVGWLYASEIFPLRMRAKAMSVSTSANWMCNFVIGLITPPMLSTLGYGTYIFFATFCFVSFFFIWLVVPETKGRSLEDMDGIFGGRTAATDAALMAEVLRQVAELEIPGVDKQSHSSA